MNIIHLAGHLGADPEVRFTSSGQKVTTLRLATRTRRGSSKDETIWWRVTVWGEQFDKMISFLKKGSSVIVVGDLNKPEIFTDRSGNPQISMGVTAIQIMFSPFGRPSSQDSQSTQKTQENIGENTTQEGIASGKQETKQESSASLQMDDEIPF